MAESVAEIRAKHTAKTDADWWCAGCGAYSQNRKRTCSCPTQAVFRIKDDDMQNAWKEDEVHLEDGDVIKRIAGELAPELDRLIDAVLSPSGPYPREELQQFLWDNKVGILRILQVAAAN